MIHDIGEITASHGNTLYKMWEVSVESGARTLRKHSHTRFEISTVTHGRGIYNAGGREYEISEGDVFIFCSNEQHCITNVESGGLVILNSHFEPSYIRAGGSDGLTAAHQGFCFSHAAAFHNRIPAEKSEPIRSLLFDIRDEFNSRSGEYALAVKSRLNLIIISLIRDFGFCEDANGESFKGFKSVMRAISYIDRHLTEPLALSDIAAQAGMSPTYFSALFKKLCQVGLWDYIISKRIEKAAYLICDDDNDYTMLQIATLCGFNSTAAFNKQFKRVTGLTPSQYRLGEIL